mmetsp:Transcript_30065/g.82566  ORF Transcript_30065/g.82566 Transcript_30065/m.82566 type:complete len:511 (+) Transcript_30065:7-1539(+)
MKKIVTIAPITSTLRLLAILLICLVSVEAANNDSPIVVLIPGDAASMLEAQFDKPTTPHVYCAKSTHGQWQTVWTPPRSQFVPGRIDCWTDTLTLRVVANRNETNTTNTTNTRNPMTTYSIENGPGINIRAVQGEAGLQLKDGNQVDNVYAALLDFLKHELGATVHVATYDFRWSPAGNPQFVQELRYMIETAYRNQFQHQDNDFKHSSSSPTKVTLLSHSLGALWVHYLLTSGAVSSAWKAQYLHAWIPISPAYGGAVLDLQQLVSGFDAGISWLSPRDFIRQQRSFESNVWLLPAPQLYGNEPLVTLYKKKKKPTVTTTSSATTSSTVSTRKMKQEKRTKSLLRHRRRQPNVPYDSLSYEIDTIYSALNYSQLFIDSGYDLYPVYDQRISHLTRWNATDDDFDTDPKTPLFQLQDPQVPVWPIYGGNQSTVAGYQYYGSLNSSTPELIYTTEGDGTVPQRSLTAGNGWSQAQRSCQIMGAGHNAILSHPDAFRRVQTVLSSSSSITLA